VQEKRQLGNAFSGLVMSNSKPAKVDMLTPKIRSTAKRACVLFGPYDFNPATNVCGPLKLMGPNIDSQRTGNWTKINGHGGWHADGSQWPSLLQETGRFLERLHCYPRLHLPGQRQGRTPRCQRRSIYSSSPHPKPFQKGKKLLHVRRWEPDNAIRLFLRLGRQ